jgi:vacuolar-type H+-ATPase subunit H
MKHHHQDLWRDGFMPEGKEWDEAELSPLDQIRLCEAEVTRRIAAARQAGEESLAKARSEAANLKRQAKERGQRKGQSQYREVVSGAEEEAQALVAKAQKRASELLQRGEKKIEIAVQKAINFVLGISDESGAS